jgi:hypothetical protein
MMMDNALVLHEIPSENDRKAMELERIALAGIDERREK